MGIKVGIDLGTTFCAVAAVDPATGRPYVIKNSFGLAVTPSVLCFEPNGGILFGEDAKNMQAVGDTNTAAFFKRSMGNALFSVEYFGKRYTSTDLSAILLKKLIEEAQQQSGETIESAVITVPAYFAHKERFATIEAGRKAGIEVIAIINEPTAAAFAYGLNEKDGEQTVLIYDLGGGTFDATIARINKDDIDIIGSDGNHELGGKDWDDCIARYLADTFAEKYGVDISDDPEAAAALIVTAETVKKQLTGRDSVNVPISCGSARGSVEITEEIFEDISDHLMSETRDVVERLLGSVSLSWGDIDGVILVGGSTRMRMVHDYVRDMSGKEPLGGVNVDEAVALGAAIRANLVPKGEKALSLAGKSKEHTLLIRGAKKVSDVTAHSLGMIAVSADGERYENSIIIPKNSKIPADNTRPFRLRTRAKSSEAEVYVTQGEFPRPLDNTVINKYVIYDIEKTDERFAVIDVTYKYDSDGVIGVEAAQKETGKRLPVRIESVPEDMSWTDGKPGEGRADGALIKTDVILAVDMSGSMIREPIEEAKKAMKLFVDEMDKAYAKIGLLPFSDNAKCEVSPTNDYEKLKKYIDALEIGEKYGYGNTGQPFDIAYSKLAKSRAEAKFVVVLTDGMWSRCEEAVKAAKKCHGADIEVIALGFGDADYNFLKRIASSDDYASLTDLSNLGGSFFKIAQVIENSKAVRRME